LPPAHLRFTGVLQRIALCFAGVVPLAIHAKNHARSGGRSRRCCSATGHCCGLGGSLSRGPTSPVVSTARRSAATSIWSTWRAAAATIRKACSARCRRWRSPWLSCCYGGGSWAMDRRGVHLKL